MRQSDSNNMLAGAIVFVLLILAILFLPSVFKRVDCNNATRALQFIERCKASEDCKLRVSDQRKKDAYTRLYLKSCPVSSDWRKEIGG